MKRILWVVAGLFISTVAVIGANVSTSKPAIQGISTQVSPAARATVTLIPSPTTAIPTLKPTATPTPTVVIKKVTPTQYIPSSTPVINSTGNLDNNKTYINSAGNEVHSPANTTDGSVPSGATARCGDGTYSFSQSRRGTCSSHGGVAEWL